MTTKGTDNRFRSLTVVGESGTPSTPASGDFKLYVADDGTFYLMDDTGTPTAVGGGLSSVTESDLSFTDITTANASTSKHGLLKKLDNNSAHFMDGTGAWSTPSGASAETYDAVITAITGAVHRWKFEESSGDFADSIGSLTLVKSGTFTYSVTSPLGTGVTFGASAKGQASGSGSIPVGANPRSFVCVYKGQTGKKALYSYGTSGSTRQWWTAFINDNGGASDGYLALATWADDLAGGAGLLDLYGTEWHISIWSYDGSSAIRVYHDGMFSQVRNMSGSLNTGSGTDFRVGIDTTGANQFGGSMTDLTVFNKYLTTAECNRLTAAFFRAVSP